MTTSRCRLPTSLRRPADALRSGLGHTSVETTTVYTAVYPRDVIDAHRLILVQRRAKRGDVDQRPITDEEWASFQRDFVERKLSLGRCGRAQGTACEHEHACVRCALLRPDPAELPKVYEIRDNLEAQIAEAQERGWLGEVQGLEVSLAGTLERIRAIEGLGTLEHGPVLLGFPLVSPPVSPPPLP